MDGTGDGGDDDLAKTKKKSKSKSPSKGKKKKTTDEDLIELIKQKEDAKVKKKWIIDEIIEIPYEITEHIETNYSKDDERELQVDEDEDPVMAHGVDIMTADEVKALVIEKYRNIYKKKLCRFTESGKMKQQFGQITKMIFHLCINVGA